LSKTKWIILAALFAVIIAGSGTRAQTLPNFSGLWKQSNERCVPRRTGEVILRIDHRDPILTVETSSSRGSAAPRQAVQRYTTDGKVSVTTGADGDEFHTSIVWSGSSLVFSIEEHEDGRVILSKETWTLTENNGVLQRVRERLDGGEKKILIYLRELPNS
jgi:hypothetical protein